MTGKHLTLSPPLEFGTLMSDISRIILPLNYFFGPLIPWLMIQFGFSHHERFDVKASSNPNTKTAFAPPRRLHLNTVDPINTKCLGRERIVSGAIR